jgi:hypothetical protein
MSSDQGTTAHGLRILAWLLTMCIGLSLAVRAAGLKYVQGIIWPTDLHSFRLMEIPPDSVDVVVMGSSRASFAITPSSLDLCLGRELGRPTRTYNLARTFATARSAHRLSQDLLTEEREPRVLLLATGPEFFDEANHRTEPDLRAHIDLQDIPMEAAHVSNLEEFFALTHPLLDGVERASLYLAQRHDDAHLRWMMTHHRGGQFCETADPRSLDGEACSENNRAIEELLHEEWYGARFMEERFADYEVGTGPVHQHMLQLIEWTQSRDIRLVIVEVPLHRDFLDEIPPEIMDRYRSYLDTLVESHGVRIFRSSDASWSKTRSRFLDPDHLNADGSQRFSREVCQALLDELEG